MKWVYFVVLLISAVIFSGCGARVYYSVESDPQFMFDKQEPIAIYFDEMSSIADKKLGRLLGELMVTEGFKVAGFNIDSQKTTCRVTFKANTSSQQYTGDYIKSQANITISSKITKKKTLYQNMDANIFCENNGRLDNIWYGFFSAKAKAYNKYEKYILIELIKLMGIDFKGYIVVKNTDN